MGVVFERQRERMDQRQVLRIFVSGQADLHVVAIEVHASGAVQAVPRGEPAGEIRIAFVAYHGMMDAVQPGRHDEAAQDRLEAAGQAHV